MRIAVIIWSSTIISEVLRTDPGLFLLRSTIPLTSQGNFHVRISRKLSGYYWLRKNVSQATTGYILQINYWLHQGSNQGPGREVEREPVALPTKLCPDVENEETGGCLDSASREGEGALWRRRMKQDWEEGVREMTLQTRCRPPPHHSKDTKSGRKKRRVPNCAVRCRHVRH